MFLKNVEEFMDEVQKILADDKYDFGEVEINVTDKYGHTARTTFYAEDKIAEAPDPIEAVKEGEELEIRNLLKNTHVKYDKDKLNTAQKVLEGSSVIRMNGELYAKVPVKDFLDLCDEFCDLSDATEGAARVIADFNKKNRK